MNTASSGTARQGQNHPVNVEKVLQTASTLFATFGYEGVGTRDIARSSGCHVPSLYYHFSSKENLYREMFDEHRADLVGAVDHAVASARGPQARLRAFVSVFFRQFTQDRELFLLLIRDLINAAVARPRYLFGPDHERFLDLLVNLLSDLPGRQADRHGAFTVMSLIFGYCCGLQLADDSDDLVEAREEELFLSILRLIGASPGHS